jgi:AcrR family transcriptional regulator
MPIPVRLLRATAEDMPGARHRPTHQEQERETRIIAAATTLMAIYGRPGLSMYGVAAALRMSPATLRRHFPDLDSLLAEILFRHLSSIAAAIGQAPALPATASMAQRRAARRAVYIRVTRGPLNAPTHAHLLLIRERHVLPPDIAENVEKLRDQIGDMLAGDNAEAALALLDTSLPAARIEAMLAATPAPVRAAPHVAVAEPRVVGVGDTKAEANARAGPA